MGDKWEGIAACVLFICIAAVFIVCSMIAAEANSDCWQRGGLMQEVAGERQCVVERGGNGR
jgi:hypothetical protein